MTITIDKPVGLRNGTGRVASTKADQTRIILTYLTGLGGRKFVVPHPNAFGEYIVNLGNAYESPMSNSDGSYPKAGSIHS